METVVVQELLAYTLLGISTLSRRKIAMVRLMNSVSQRALGKNGKTGGHYFTQAETTSMIS